MTNKQYVLKLSSQSQITLPSQLRRELRLKPGARVTIEVTGQNSLKITDRLPIEQYFGTLPNLWTDGQDAAEYTRKLRDSMQPKLSDNHD